MPEHFLYWTIVPVGEVLPLPKDTRALDVKLVDVTRGKYTYHGVLLTIALEVKTIEDAKALSVIVARVAEEAWKAAELQNNVALPVKGDSQVSPSFGSLNLKERVRAGQEAIERECITEAIALCRSKTTVSEVLGVSRPTLDAKIELYGIRWEAPHDIYEELGEARINDLRNRCNLKERVRCVQEKIEERIIREAMALYRSKARAVEALGISRPTLDAKLELYGIEWERCGDAPEVSSAGSQADTDVWNSGYRNETRSENIDEERETKASEEPASS